MHIGDFVRLRGTDIYGEILGVNATHIEIYYLVRGPKCNGKIWTYSGDWYSLPRNHVVEVFPLRGNILKCLKSMGFRALNEHEFVRLDEEEHPDMIHVELGIDDDDMNTSADEEDGDDGDVDMDAEYTLFTRADERRGDRFVLDTHFAVDSFRRWNPQTQQGQHIKAFIDRLEEKYAST